MERLERFHSCNSFSWLEEVSYEMGWLARKEIDGNDSLLARHNPHLMDFRGPGVRAEGCTFGDANYQTSYLICGMLLFILLQRSVFSEEQVPSPSIPLLSIRKNFTSLTFAILSYKQHINMRFSITFTLLASLLTLASAQFSDTLEGPAPVSKNLARAAALMLRQVYVDCESKSPLLSRPQYSLPTPQ